MGLSGKKPEFIHLKTKIFSKSSVIDLPIPSLTPPQPPKNGECSLL
ncbi:hypothetical protein CWATWH0402_2996 [Crocosphaera watsonii WH 0402]|uniref:Uncharacterized protein n=1 Tax=Crocosphaera watsonii WH 0402 TaxID=1284629 RepID=T2JXQ0_CROWT|nr:hypothetical protein CWATWH0402_2996 [Crocosphaera watsonii WH 0402]